MNAQVKVVKNYDAMDLQDAHSLAQADLNWMHTAIIHVRTEIKALQDKAQRGERITEYHFATLMEHLHMYEYLAEDRMNYHDMQAKTYAP